ncbi:MFS transporter [Saccharicrinis sp. FJH2]|uniref:MFS transporter n=1 Tax=Saccharicrinis sp. FJH65 TaxID=3344659 RepID=UPI0035F407AB
MVTISKEVRKDPMYLFLLMLVISAAVSFQGWRTLYSNFAVDVIGINGFQNGIVQAVREIPGFLSFAVVFLLLFLKENQIGYLSVLLLALGVMITGFFPSFTGLIVTTFIMSVGFHYYETVNQSLTLQSFNLKTAPLVLAKLRSIMSIANVLIGAAIIGLAYILPLKWIYVVLGGSVLILVVYTIFKFPAREPEIKQHKRIILKKRYWLFYLLNFLSGARRQIFVVFALFMLVEKYHFSVQQIALLYAVNNLITWQLNPYIGKWINKFGERKVLSMEYMSLIFVFIGYAFIEEPIIVALLYIVDHIFFGFSIGIKTFFQKTADPKDIAPSMATGFTINHIMAVFMPVVGGALWIWNWRLPFLVGSGIAVTSLIFAQYIRVPEEQE